MRVCGGFGARASVTLVLLAVLLSVAPTATLATQPYDEALDSFRQSSPVRVYVACGFHGREWATVDLCEAMKRRVEELQSRATADRPFWTDWYFDTNVNPDGVRAARTVDGSECQRGNSRGVDINRNFPPIKCPFGGAPARPPFMRMVGRDAEDYPGASPLSEYESRQVVAHIREFRPDIALFIHTGTVGLMLPYDSCFEPAGTTDVLRMVEVAGRIAEVVGIDKTKIAKSTTRMSPAVGTATDYAFEEMGVPFAFTVETYEMPVKCEGARELLRKPSARYTSADCVKAFVPHSASDNCRRPDMASYIDKWVKLVDGVERVVSMDPKERAILANWLEKDIVPKSMIVRMEEEAQARVDDEAGEPDPYIQ